jgi:chemotaxis response regulator CheB
MKRVLVIADSGSSMGAITSAVMELRRAEIVGYGNSRTRLDRILGRACPDLVVLADLRTLDGALDRLMEVEHAAPHAKVVVISARCDAGWLTEVLRARAAAVVPGSLEPHTLGIVLREVVEERDRAVQPPAGHRHVRNSAGSIARRPGDAVRVRRPAAAQGESGVTGTNIGSALNKEVPVRPISTSTREWRVA